MPKDVTSTEQKGWIYKKHSHTKWEGDDIVRSTLGELLKSGTALGVGNINHKGHVNIAVHERKYPEQYTSPWGVYLDSHDNSENMARREKAKGLPDVRTVMVRPNVARNFDIALLMVDEIKRTGGSVAVTSDYDSKSGKVTVTYFDSSESRKFRG